MKTNNGKLSRLKLAAISALLVEPTLGRSAQRVGVSVRTIKNWLAREDFRAALDQAREEVLADALGHLKATSRDAVNTLRQCLRAGRDGDKIRAALGLLDHNLKVKTIVEQEERLRAIEAALAAQNQKGT